jgi:hypothetical protein
MGFHFFGLHPFPQVISMMALMTPVSGRVNPSKSFGTSSNEVR